MSVPTLSASTSATPVPVICQARINVPLPTYDWNAADQMHEFRLFKCQLDTWIEFCKVKAEEHLDYLLCILGKEGDAAMTHWVPTDEAHKQDLKKILDYLESTLDNEISPKFKYMSLRISRRGLTNCHRFTTPLRRGGSCTRSMVVDKRLNTLDFYIFDDGVYSEGCCTKEISARKCHTKGLCYI